MSTELAQALSAPVGVAHQLNRLIALERASLDACDAAAGRLDDLSQRAGLRDMVRNHLQTVDDLMGAVRESGGRPAQTKADVRHGRAEVRALTGRVLLAAVLANYDTIVAGYDRAIEHTAARSVKAHRVLKRCAKRHRRNRAWLLRHLGGS